MYIGCAEMIMYKNSHTHISLSVLYSINNRDVVVIVIRPIYLVSDNNNRTTKRIQHRIIGKGKAKKGKPKKGNQMATQIEVNSNFR